jgi:hypothetical protein
VWLKAASDLGGYEIFGILRCAQDDSKNKQRQGKDELIEGKAGRSKAAEVEVVF